jgi:hypothetical protein
MRRIPRVGALMIAALAVMAGAFMAGRATVSAHPRGCTFDGGGTLVSGDAGRTSDGHIWACADGQLYRMR